MRTRTSARARIVQITALLSSALSSAQEQGLLWSGRLPCAFASASVMY